MKRCQVCGAMADADAKTCAKCGEASWKALSEFARVTVMVPIDPALEFTSIEVEEPQRRQQSKRRGR